MSLIKPRLHTWLATEEKLENLVIVTVFAIGAAMNLHYFFW